MCAGCQAQYLLSCQRVLSNNSGAAGGRKGLPAGLDSEVDPNMEEESGDTSSRSSARALAEHPKLSQQPFLPSHRECGVCNDFPSRKGPPGDTHEISQRGEEDGHQNKSRCCAQTKRSGLGLWPALGGVPRRKHFLSLKANPSPTEFPVPSS